MFSELAALYQHSVCLEENRNNSHPTEAELQALWFESLIKNHVTTDLGKCIQIIQPGFWNHAAGPDFFQSAIKDESGEIKVGAVELHLRATDWEVHGHHADERYEETLLHGIWHRPQNPYFPATQSFRRVDQVVLSEFLLAPWNELRFLLDPLHLKSAPTAQPGLCHRALLQSSPEQIVHLLRSAGAWRFRRKAERLWWRIHTRGNVQTLWESLAEALGYSQNKVPFRLLAQRLPASLPELRTTCRRAALLFGLAGLLPAEHWSMINDQAQRLVRPLWDYWWKERDRLKYAQLPRDIWCMANLRPSNRPERRLGALSALHPHLNKLQQSIEEGDPERFTKILTSLYDPFWSFHITWRGKARPCTTQLIGGERCQDILVNVFWPLVSLVKEDLAFEAIRRLQTPPNRMTRIAQERVLGSISLGKALKETLIQQGLQHIYHDYCRADSTNCANCVFPAKLSLKN